MQYSTLFRLPLLIVASGSLLLGCAQPAPQVASTPTSAASSRTVSWGEHVDLPEFQLVTEQEDVTIIDVRTPEEFAGGHLPDAINIDVTASDFGDRIAELDPEGTYAIYCRSGNRSRHAQAQLVQAGFDHTVALRGGINVWDGAIE
ncbi:MAG: rhodanese-like domain-containing protein [Bowdeniella nasicola]|nr:rhodanese-like domain-containing protein [Bowdeniella nasicola]